MIEGEINPAVKRPPHYQSLSSDPKLQGLQVEDCMRIAYGEEVVKHFYLCSANKYVSRSPRKGKNQDIKKAIECLERFLALGGFND